MKKIIEKHIVPEGTEKTRLSDYACEVFLSIPSRKSIKKSIKRGDVSINGRKAFTGDWIEPGQIIELHDNETAKTEFYRISIEIIYEDEYIAVINKPPGIPVNGNRFKTVENALPLNLKISQAKSPLQWPRPVHRLDSPTSGLLLIAKTGEAMVNLSSQFADKSVKKKYRAIVTGDLQGEGVINSPVDGREALTEFRSLKTMPSNCRG
jgi:23S rRNA-/tRNA-specific pseudouridylate synthase